MSLAEKSHQVSESFESLKWDLRLVVDVKLENDEVDVLMEVICTTERVVASEGRHRKLEHFAIS